VEWFIEVGGREGRRPVRGTEGVYSPGEHRLVTAQLEPGEYDVYVPAHREKGARLTVNEGGGSARLELHVEPDGSVREKQLALAPGARQIDVHYGYVRNWALGFFPVGLMPNWVSAAYVTSLQDFRDLFSAEFLAPDVSFAVRSVTLMFTDVKGSTELYERLGDAPAYKRVQDHFRLLAEIVRRHQGGIVKTIGDAVMASFPVNLDAVNAALEIQRDFRERAAELGGLEVKVGLHRGPAIAVTSNRLLDFFGRTVNIAARVQHEAEACEVVLSPEVIADPSTEAALADRALSRSTRRARLKGVAGEVTLHSIKRTLPA
jgi:class 3 adenylate cyclase